MKVEALWRYPFKSMAGEQLDEVAVGIRGFPGDRAFAVRQNDVTRNAKKYPALMAMRAWYEDDPKSTPPVIELEDGRRFAADDTELPAAISKIIGTDVGISALAPVDDLEFYRRREKRSLEETRAILGLVDGEPLPDLSKMPGRVAEFASPPGTFFDAYPLLVMTTSSLEALQAAAPKSVIDVRRFRPNILIDTDEPGFVEQAWPGSKLRIGDLVLSLDVPCPRCVMTTVGFHDLPRDPKIMRTLVESCQHELGVYAEIETTGIIRVGDEAHLQ